MTLPTSNSQNNHTYIATRKSGKISNYDIWKLNNEVDLSFDMSHNFVDKENVKKINKNI